MREFTPVDINSTPMEQENHVLNWFRDSGVTKPKRLVAMANSIAHMTPDFIKRSLIRNVLVARHPAKYLAEAYKEMDDYPIIIQGLIADGNHGMLMHEAKIYGMVVNARWASWMKTNDRWSPEQEAELQNELVDDWMEKNIVRHFEGRIVLFKDFGFSGMARKVFQSMSKEHYDKLKADRNTLVNLQKALG